MKPGPIFSSKILVEIIKIDSEPRAALEWLVEIILTNGWFTSIEDAREAAEAWVDRFIKILKDNLSELNRLGRFCLYSFNSSSDYMIQGSAFIEPNDPENVKEEKIKRSFFNEYKTAIGRITPREFEALCVGILFEFGVKNPKLTQYTADEGIDFYGRISLESLMTYGLTYPGVYRQLNAWMIGQAKHYRESQVSTFEIRGLVGAIELAKAGVYSSSVANKALEMNVKACDPVFHLFFTTGNISANSWRLLERSGVVGMDGEMVSAFLAEKDIGIKKNRFNSVKFQQWIRTHSRRD